MRSQMTQLITLNTAHFTVMLSTHQARRDLRRANYDALDEQYISTCSKPTRSVS